MIINLWYRTDWICNLCGRAYNRWKMSCECEHKEKVEDDKINED